MRSKTTDNGNGVGLPDAAPWNAPPVALFWDQSLVWGLICLQTLNRLGIPFHLLSGADIANGALLEGYRVLLVPGGWAAHKSLALGRAGKAQIRRFIEAHGGSYLGFCGGAGLALTSPSTLDLVPLERMSLMERLPNASGEVWVRGVPGHPAWKDLPPMVPVSIWWPAQFTGQPLPRTLCLAHYVSVGANFWVADLCVPDLESDTFPWSEWEKVYGINLNPARLLGHPAIMEMRSGKGRLVLSYAHLETPDDSWGNRLLRQLLGYLDQESARHIRSNQTPAEPPCLHGTAFGSETLRHLSRAQEAIEELIRFGERHLLWGWRNSWLLHWRRGVRGLEYGTLAVTMQTMIEKARGIALAQGQTDDPWLASARRIEHLALPFAQSARELLIEEKLAANRSHLSKHGAVSDTVDRLRTRLFGSRMQHAGLCRSLFDELDGLLLQLLRKSV